MAYDAADSGIRRPHPVLDPDSFGARSRDGASCAPLTVLQYALLHYLAYLPPAKVATWLDLAAAMEPYNAEPMTSRVIQWHVWGLRHRLSRRNAYHPPGGVPWPRSLIVTVRGRGLRLDWSILPVTRCANTTPTQRKRKANPGSSKVG